MRLRTGGVERSVLRQDVVSHHFCVAHGTKHDCHPYGMFISRAEFNEGLVQALPSARPPGEVSAQDEVLAARVQALADEGKLFSHGHMHLGNICVEGDANVTGLIDWGGAGLSIHQCDYLEEAALVQAILGRCVEEGVLPGRERRLWFVARV
ncbi:hypothetical protein PSPO01_14132 [Paraphaeosphaeria sporulosa]